MGAHVRHGHTRDYKKTAIYHCWDGMIDRCLNPKSKYFPRYGGRGITVCQRWQGEGGFERFYADMGDRPPGLSLDRIDNNGNYEPGNCRWATRSQQSCNRRSNRLLAHDGRIQAVSAWAKELGISRQRLRWRLERGWSIAQALSTQDGRSQP